MATSSSAAGDGLERQPLGQQRARRIEAQAFDKVCRGLARGVGELAIEAALRQARAPGERRHVGLQRQRLELVGAGA